MARTGIGLFQPSENLYSKDPNRFKDVLEAQGNKEAAYLASMDQFFVELEEKKREFDKTAKQRDSELGATLSMSAERLKAQKDENALDRELKRQELETLKESNNANRQLDYERLRVTDENADLDRAFRYDELNRQDENADEANETKRGEGRGRDAESAEARRDALNIKKQELEMSREKNAFFRDLYERKDTRLQEEHDFASQRLNEQRTGISNMDYSGIDFSGSGANYDRYKYNDTTDYESYDLSNWE